MMDCVVAGLMPIEVASNFMESAVPGINICMTEIHRVL